jgi:hypothetical protein
VGTNRTLHILVSAHEKIRRQRRVNSAEQVGEDKKLLDVGWRLAKTSRLAPNPGGEHSIHVAQDFRENARTKVEARYLLHSSTLNLIRSFTHISATLSSPFDTKRIPQTPI